MDAVDEELVKLGVILVEDRVLRRVIKAHRKVRAVGLAVPHEHCYTLATDELLQHVEPREIPVEPAALPVRVILVRGDRAAIARGQPEVLSQLWRQIFHARVHQAFDERLAAGELTAAGIRERVHRIGQAEFDEIRSVLRQEELLLPPVDDAGTYFEFVALYLELRYFAPRAVARTFPAMFDTAQVDAAIGLDLDPEALLAESRPGRAPERPVTPAAPPDPAPPPAVIEQPVPSARNAARRARAKGNRSRAAILAARGGDRAAARADLDELVARLGRAVGGAPGEGWAEALVPLAQLMAARRVLRFAAGARLLHDLQSACVVAERETRVVDVVAWALSRGARPVVRPLPATREVKIAKHLHAAVHKIAAAGLAGPARDRLSEALHEMARRADDQVRAVLRPKLEAALEEVGLEPHSLPERVAEKTLVDELLDRAVLVGRLSLGDLRDALSRNELKLPELSVADLRGGDSLLRADRILAGSLDGVYRRGESYMRGLQKVSSVMFGTRIGRWLTLYAILPFLGSFALLEGLQHTVGVLLEKLLHDKLQIYSRPALLIGAGALFLLMHVPPFRRAVSWVVRGIGRGLRLVLFDAPLAVWRNPFVQRVLGSRFMRWVVKPALPAALAVWIAWTWWRWVIGGAIYLVVALALSSRIGRRLEEIVLDWLVRSGRHLTSRVVPALLKYVLRLFVELVEVFDRALYRVDEWLRFRTGQSVIAIAVKGLFGALWFLITYVLRLYVNLFIEPTVNPIKHFPVVTVAAKLILPFAPAMISGMASPASALMGPALGQGFAAFTFLVLPGLAGFLVWELSANWKLYRATRAKALRPRAIGHHGESMARFLKPGFHSGTIPKLFTKLRRAAWRNDPSAISRHKEGLHHVEEAVGIFAERQLVAMLNECEAFGATDLAVQHVEIGSNRVQISLACPSVAPAPATIRFELQSGWLVAGLPTPGWIDALGAAQRRIFEIALAGFYKQAAVDLVREQIEHALQSHPGAEAPPYDIADEGLVVWPARSFEVEVVYDLRAPSLRPAVRGDKADQAQAAVIDLAGRHTMFGREPLYWSVWATTWQQIARGEAPIPIIVGPGLLPGSPAA